MLLEKCLSRVIRANTSFFRSDFFVLISSRACNVS